MRVRDSLLGPQRVANKEALPYYPIEDFGLMIFQKQMSFRFHIFIQACHMVVANVSPEQLIMDPLADRTGHYGESGK